MKKIVAILFTLMAITVYADNQEKFIGSWKFNVEKLKESEKFKEAAKDPQSAMMMQMMVEMFSKMTLNVTKTEMIMIIPNGEEKKEDKSTYSITSDKDNQLEISIKGQNSDTPEVIIITFIDEKNIKMEPKVKGEGQMPDFFLIKQ